MPKGYPTLSPEQKEEIINRIKEKGERVPELTKEYGIVPKTIYNLLRKTAQGPGALLELAKLKREKDALLQIIGQLTAQEKLGKKGNMAAAISELSPPKSKAELAKQLGVSRSALYYKLKLPAKDLALKAEIEIVMSCHKAYGHKRIADHLNINKKRIRRVMKLFGIKVKRKRKKPFKPRDRGQAPMAIPNLVLRLAISAPRQVWVKDFTYLPYFGKFVYLATVEDVFTRRVIGWAISTKHNVNLVALTLLDALMFNPAPQISHSDQGSEYRDKEYLNLLKSLNIKPSMSAKSSPWQNGYQKSFYSGFKLELGHSEIYPTLGELYEAIAAQIYYYNNLRIHTALRCPPAVFAQRLNCQNIKLINQGNPVRLSV